MIRAIYVFMSCVTLLVAQGARAESTEEPVKVTVCQLLENPGKYNHMLIEIAGSISRGFEDFTLNDRSCEVRNASWIWLELGGVKSSETYYCCGVRTDSVRAKPLEVEGIVTTLLNDAKFRQFQNMTTWSGGGGSAYATVVGRFFSGNLQTLPIGERWMGYGHFGMGTLLVIQQVKEVKFNNTPNVRRHRSGPR